MRPDFSYDPGSPAPHKLLYSSNFYPGFATSAVSEALRLTSVHWRAGRVDAYYERGLNDWDLAAGGLIAAEAGAVIGGRHDDGGAYAGAAPGIANAFFALVENTGAHTA